MLLAIALAGCAARIPTPALCDMPPGYRSWQRASVSWTGVVIGEPHHGYVLACEERLGGIRIDWDDDIVGGRAFQEALDRQFLREGLLRITVEGRLGRSYGPGRFGLSQDPPVLRINAVRRIEFIPTADAEFNAFLGRRR